MLVGQFCNLAPSWRALYEAFLYEERFVHLLHRASVLAYGGGDGVDAHGTALELVYDGQQYLVVYLVQAIAVDIQCLQGIACYVHVYPAVALHLCKVAHTAQQGIGYTWRATAAAGYFAGGLALYGHAQNAGTPQDNLLQGDAVVIFQVQVYAETGTQGSGEQTASCGGAHQGERCQVYLYGACRGPLVYHYVYSVVLHGGIEVFLHHGTEAVYLVYEENVVRFQGRQYAGQVAGFVKHRARCQFEPYAQFVGNDVAQRGLAQARRSVQQGVVQGLAPVFGGLHEYAQVLHHLLLSAEVLEFQRT